MANTYRQRHAHGQRCSRKMKNFFILNKTSKKVSLCTHISNVIQMSFAFDSEYLFVCSWILQLLRGFLSTDLSINIEIRTVKVVEKIAYLQL